MKYLRFKKAIAVILALAVSLAMLTALTGCGDVYNYELLIREGNSIDSVFTLYKQEHPDATIDDFVEKYIAYETEPGEFAANRALRSAISIRCSFNYSYTNALNRVQSGVSNAAGAGVIYSIDRDTGTAYVITNYHVVYQVITNSSGDTVLDEGISDKITVFTYGREYSDLGINAGMVGGSMDEDIAVLTVTDDIFKTDFFEPLTWTDEEGAAKDKISDTEVTVGERAIACGNPEGGGISVTSGVISVVSEEITMYKLNNPKKTVTSRVMRVDTAINPGNSGGALYNRSGRFIGLVNAKSGDTDIENIGFSIPATVAIGITQNVIDTVGITLKGGSGLRFTLGITTKVDHIDVSWSDHAVIVETVVIDSVTKNDLGGEQVPAFGILNAGDALLEAKLSNLEQGIMITRGYQLREYLFNARVGSTITIKLVREGEEISVDIALTKYADFNAA